jgi:hypothetical protein
LNVLRLFQVRRRVGIQPYERTYAGLIVPAAAAALAALAVHAALQGHSWLLSLLATSACGLVAYVALLPLVLPAEERAILRAKLPA